MDENGTAPAPEGAAETVEAPQVSEAPEAEETSQPAEAVAAAPAETPEAPAAPAETTAETPAEAPAETAVAAEPEEISYHAVEKEGHVAAIWEMQGRKHLRTIDPRSSEGKQIMELYTAEVHE